MHAGSCTNVVRQSCAPNVKLKQRSKTRAVTATSTLKNTLHFHVSLTLTSVCAEQKQCHHERKKIPPPRPRRTPSIAPEQGLPSAVQTVQEHSKGFEVHTQPKCLPMHMVRLWVCAFAIWCHDLSILRHGVWYVDGTDLVLTKTRQFFDSVLMDQKWLE